MNENKLIATRLAYDNLGGSRRRVSARVRLNREAYTHWNAKNDILSGNMYERVRQRGLVIKFSEELE